MGNPLSYLTLLYPLIYWVYSWAPLSPPPFFYIALLLVEYICSEHDYLCPTILSHCSYGSYLLVYPIPPLPPSKALNTLYHTLHYPGSCHSIAYYTILILWAGIEAELPSVDLLFLKIHYLENINHLDLRYTLLSYRSA